MISSISTKSLHGKSSLEKKFLLLWASLNGPELESEFVFAPPRKWRFDFCFQRFFGVDFGATTNLSTGEVFTSKSINEKKFIAIELEGGIWVKGAHSRGKHFNSDAEKYNTAQLLGWKVFRLTTDMINARHVQPIVDLCK